MQRILIIGATSCIAGDIARRYSAAGAQLFLVARNSDKLRRLEDELGGSVVGTAYYDFNDVDKVPSVLTAARSRLKEIDLVVIAHGRLGDQELSEHDYHEALATTATNYLSVVSQLLPLSEILLAQGRGHIAVISSVAGMRGRPRNYTYGAAKAALTIYLQGLRSRLYPTVRITTVLLGPVETPMTTRHEKNALFLKSPDAARRIVRAIGSGKEDVVIPGVFRAILFLVKLLPERVFQRIPAISGR
jgi:decaprenylphospho-beta-D-erythro-pentofuranosid-2-ulose 2-reductase